MKNASKDFDSIHTIIPFGLVSNERAFQVIYPDGSFSNFFKSIHQSKDGYVDYIAMLCNDNDISFTHAEIDIDDKFEDVFSGFDKIERIFYVEVNVG